MKKAADMTHACAIFFKAVLIFGLCTQTGTGTVSTALSGLCAVRTVLLALRPLHSPDRRVLLTACQDIRSTPNKIAFNATTCLAPVFRSC